MPLANWIESNIHFPTTVSALPGKVRLWSYQRGICDAIDALSGADVDVVTVGVFDLPKVSTDVFAVGTACYRDDTAKLVTSIAGTANLKIGIAVEARANPSGFAHVRLNGTF